MNIAKSSKSMVKKGKKDDPVDYDKIIKRNVFVGELKENIKINR
jgi:hypothetical protein